MVQISKTFIQTVLILTLVTCLIISGATAATEIDGRPNNPYGVQLGMSGSDSSDYASIHFQWARDLIGDWGHVRVYIGIGDMDIHGTVRTLAIARAKKLIPVMTALHVPEEYRIPGGQDLAPYIMDDYPLAAEHYGNFLSELTKMGAVIPYLEIGNEINGKWEPEAYGRFMISVGKAMKEAMPEMNITSAGLAGNGADFLDDMLTAVPEAKDYIDCWGLHPYGANRPPSYDEDGLTLRGHHWTAAALRRHGIEDPKFVMTESGYELGNKRDGRFPRITDELRAEYLVEAFDTVWGPDPSVVSQMLFILHTTIFPGWDGWVLIDRDCRETETYRALAAVPKPQGSDWMPTGDRRISGRITDEDSGQGLERVFVYTVPGIYAAETDSNGYYAIEDLPAGTYEIHMFRDGFDAPPVMSADVADSRTATFNATMLRKGFLARTMNGAAENKTVYGWEPTEGNPDDSYAADTQIKRNGTASQRLSARPGNPPGIWTATGNASAVPDRAFAAEVWVRGEGVRLGDGKGAILNLSVTDSGANPLSIAEVTLPLEGDFEWTPISVSIAPHPPGRRLVMSMKFDAEEGTVWFDNPYCHYADYPVPSRITMGQGTATVEGVVVAERGEFMANAVVCLTPGNFWTTAGSDGSYTVSGVPAGSYDVFAFKRGKQPIPVYDLRVHDGRIHELRLEMRNPPAPRAIQNPSFLERGPDKYYTPGWQKYNEFDGIPENGWHPEVPEHPNGFNARTGNSFAGSIAGSNVKNGGLYQILEVDPDKTYEVSVWSYTYQTNEGHRGDVANRLGIDPTGGDDPNGIYVIWTPYTPSHKEWTQLSLRVAPVYNRMTIFLDAKQVHGLMFNVNCFDDVEMREVPESLPAPQMALESRVAGSIQELPKVEQSNTRMEAYDPKFLWGFTAPGVDPWEAEGADDIGPPRAIRREYIRQSGATFFGIHGSWREAEPQRLPGGATMDDFDWTKFDEELDQIPERMAVLCMFNLDAPWAGRLEDENEEEYWRLAERFLEFAARRAHARGVRYYDTPGNEMSLTGRHDWGELLMKPIRHYSRAIKRGHPDNQIIGGALVAGQRHLIDVLYAHGFKDHVDVLDIHAYANNPGEMRYNVGLSQILETRQTLEDYGDGHKKIFLGEGWSVFPLPQHIDHLKEPPTYTDEDFKHYRRAVVYGYAALTTPRPEYNPEWLLGAKFFCLNDLWGSMGWKDRAEIEYDDEGEPAFWHLDGYKFPYHPDMMEPQFRTWGIIDIEGNPKGDIIYKFPPYIPKSTITAEFVEEGIETLYPGRPYHVRVSFTNNEPEPFTNLRFSMDAFLGRNYHMQFHDLGTPVPDSLAQGETAVREFHLVVNPDQVGKEIWVQGGCEYDWLDESYYTDGWLKFNVGSPGSFELQPHNGLASSTDGEVRMRFVVTDRTGAPLPDSLQIAVDGAVEVEQTFFTEEEGIGMYDVVFSKKDTSAGGHSLANVTADPKFPTIEAGIAFPRPGRTPEQYPAKGRLINPGFEEYGPGSGFEAWDGPPSNWSDEDLIAELPNSGERYIMKAWHGMSYPAENSQVVLVPDSFSAGDTVTASVWWRGFATVDATNHEAVRFRISIEFRNEHGHVIRRENSPLMRGTDQWEQLVLTTEGAPEGTHSVRVILFHENTDDNSWHMAMMDNADLRFGR